MLPSRLLERSRRSSIFLHGYSSFKDRRSCQRHRHRHRHRRYRQDLHPHNLPLLFLHTRRDFVTVANFNTGKILTTICTTCTYPRQNVYNKDNIPFSCRRKLIRSNLILSFSPTFQRSNDPLSFPSSIAEMKN